jgi:hypothetical protein
MSVRTLSRLLDLSPPLRIAPAMSDPYIQSLFADRIGGKNYGKGTGYINSRRSSVPAARRRPPIRVLS